MNFEATPWQRFLIIWMAFAETMDEREPTFADAPIEKKERDAIPKNLVAVKVSGRSKQLLLQEDAWQFVIENLGLPLPATAKAGVLLQRILKKLGGFVGSNGGSLQDFIGEVGPARPRAPRAAPKKRAPQKKPPQVAPTADEIRKLCLSLGGGQTGKRVRLADLRPQVRASRDALDDLLKSMQQQGRLVLFKMDNPAEITPADESAALIIAGNPRHLVYLEA